MPEQAQRPQARAAAAAVGGVVGHHLGIRGDAPAAQRGGEIALERQRMAAEPRARGLERSPLRSA